MTINIEHYIHVAKHFEFDLVSGHIVDSITCQPRYGFYLSTCKSTWVIQDASLIVVDHDYWRIHRLTSNFGFCIIYSSYRPLKLLYSHISTKELANDVLEYFNHTELLFI